MGTLRRLPFLACYVRAVAFMRFWREWRLFEAASFCSHDLLHLVQLVGKLDTTKAARSVQMARDPPGR